MIKYINIVLLVCVFIASSQISIKADFVPGGLFDNYLDVGGVDIDKFTDAIMNNEIEVDNKNTIHFLETFSKHDLQLLRNTIFAKHGFIFKTKELHNYFNNKPWYTPKISKVKLSAKEEKIVSLIIRIENCDNIKFDDFYKLFIPLGLPFSYTQDTKSNNINRIIVRKYLNNETNTYWLSYNAIGELYKNKNFMVLLYDIQTIETQPSIATFSLDGKLISNKTFFSIGGDITHSTNGKLFIDEDLTIRVDIEESEGNEIKNNKSEKYFIDSNGIIKKVK